MFADAYRGKKVLVTGHTGFKGSWLSTWLLELGSDVAGYSLDVPTEPSNFRVLALDERLRHYQGDVRDLDRVRAVMEEFEPDVVFHLAAQALVRRSYRDPVTTFETNAMGTMNVLEALRTAESVQAGVFITSDKCYRNVEWPWGYREDDTLGGEDPYSGSKGCAELVFYSYFHSYFTQRDGMARIASARAGNVIGGGDWAEDRILPDCVRAWVKGETVTLRNPDATRPWQHVLEPLSGYLWLGAHLLADPEGIVGNSYNFGPLPTVDEPVSRLVEKVGDHWPAARWAAQKDTDALQPEARLLKLACDRALHHMGWRAVMNFNETVALTADWYRAHHEGTEEDMFGYTLAQIRSYEALAAERGLPWAGSDD